MRNVALSLAAVAFLLSPLTAQSGGDALVYFATGGNLNLLAVTPGGTVTTVLTRPGAADGIAAAPGNRGAIFGEVKSTGVEVLQFYNGSVTTLATLPSNMTRLPSMMVEQGGDILMLNSTSGNHGVFRMPGSGGAVTTVAHNTMGASFGFPFAMAEDIVTGDTLVLDVQRKLHRITSQGKVSTVAMILPPSISIAVLGNVHSDRDTGNLVLTFGSFLLGVDPNTGTVTTFQGPTSTGRSLYYGIDADPYGGGYYVSEFQSSPASGRNLLRYDAGQNTISTVGSLPSGTLGDVHTWASKMLSGQSRPQVGSAYTIALSIPSEGGSGYMAAASMGTLIGIPAGAAGKIPLDPDPLFFLSIQAPTIFSNFQGILNASGTTALAVNIPNIGPLSGLRIFIAVVTFDNQGIRVISEALGVTIE